MTRLFIDSAEPCDWTPRAELPPFQGATTNPTLLCKAGLRVSLESYLDLIKAAGDKGLAELMLQAARPDPLELSFWLEHLIPAAAQCRIKLTIKIPCHPDWTQALKTVKAHALPTLLTGLSNPIQLLWAHAQGADFVAPYVGRIAETGRDPWPLLEACIPFQPKGLRLLAASIRDLDTLARLMALGSHAVTLRPEFLRLHATDDLTLAAIEQFSGDVDKSLSGDR